MTEFPSPHDPTDESPPLDPDAGGELTPASTAPEFGEDELLEAANAPLDATPGDEPEVTEAFEWSDAEPPPMVESDTDPKPAPDAEPVGATLPPPPGPTQPGQPQPGPPPYHQPPVRRIYRSRHDRKIGGVSAGIAEFFRVDPTIVRLATLVFAVTGVGILVYIAAWFIIPMRPEGFVEPPRTTPMANDRTMSLALGVAALALAFGIITGSWAVLAIALIGGGVWLLSERTAVAPATSTPVGSYEPMAYAAPPYASPVPATAQAGSPPPPSWPEEPPVRERKPQRVTWVVLSLLALLAAVGISAASGDWWDVSATRFLGIGVIIIGVGVVVGQIRGGGARGLIPLGIIAALALFPVSAVDGLLDEGVGDTVYRPTSIVELQDSYEHGIGQLTVDLSRVDLAGSERTIDIDLGIGELIVIVSEEAGGQAVLQAKAGEVSHQLPNTDSFLFDEGVNIESGTVLLLGDDGSLDLNIDVGLGTAELRSVPGR